MHPNAAPEDVFDSLLNLEESFHTEGVTTSQIDGTAAGLSTGHSMGFKTGAALTTELEFYHGAATTLISLHSSFPTKIPVKALQAAQRLLSLYKSPLSIIGNDPTLDMDAYANSLRTAFRQMTAFAKLHLRYNLTNRSKLADLSF